MVKFCNLFARVQHLPFIISRLGLKFLTSNTYLYLLCQKPYKILQLFVPIASYSSTYLLSVHKKKISKEEKKNKKATKRLHSYIREYTTWRKIHTKC